MLAYILQCNDSESTIKKYNFFYKNTKQKPKYFRDAGNFFETMKSFEKQNKDLFCIMYKLYNSIFVIL